MKARAALALPALVAALSAAPVAARADDPPLAAAQIREHLGAKLPLELALRDSSGRERRLGELLGDEPAILVLAYYHCTMLCGLVLDGAANAIAGLERARDPDVPPFRVLAVSIDPRDDATSARRRQTPLLSRLGWPAMRWPFMTGDPDAVRELAEQVGFDYRYDDTSDQYAHPAVLTVLGPRGTIASYLYGVEFTPDQLATALRAAQNGDIRSPLQRVLLRCYHYVPALRRYQGEIVWLLRAGGALTLLACVPLLLRLRRAERARREAP